jgi:beta-lactamase regulating signal transducer with metallopeptidase domain
MSALIDYLLMTSAQASVIILALLASSRWLAPRMPAKWLFGFWVVALLRLVIPGVTPGGLPIGSLAPREASSGTGSASHSPGMESPPSASRQGDRHHETLPGSAIAMGAGDSPSAAPVDSSARTWPRLAFGLWIVGVVAGAGWILWQQLRLCLIVRRSRSVTDPATLALFQECKALMGVGRPVSVFETTALRGPALVGVWRPRILLPAGMAGSTSPLALRHVFLHELAHLRRHDLAMNWLTAWAGILHWFNPLVRLACSRMRSQQEIACDEKVLGILPSHEWRQYGHTLLDLSGSFTSTAAAGRVGILENHKHLEQRILMIKNHHHQRPLAAGLLAPVVLLGFSTVSILHVSAADRTSPEDPKHPVQAAATADRADAPKKAELHVVTGKYGHTFYHLRYLLTPGNCELSIPNDQRSPRYGDSNACTFEQGGQFEVFIPAPAFPVAVETPDHKPGFLILRMPYTAPDDADATRKIAGKRSLFDRIQRMKSEGNGSVEVVIELPLDQVEVVEKQPLQVKMNGINLSFRQAFGRYIGYTGPLKEEDKVE